MASPSSAPLRSSRTGAAGVCRRATTRTHRSIAIPMQSNPEPKLAVDPGTRTVTLALIDIPYKEKARGNGALGGTLV
jgi:hypothetical protein